MIRLLVSRKLLVIERRFRADGSCTSNGYRLAMDHPVNLTGEGVKLTGRVFTHEQGACSPVTPPLVNGEQETTTEPCSLSNTTTTTGVCRWRGCADEASASWWWS